jgi:hypothetical protein
MPFDIDLFVQRAAGDGRLEADRADRWLAEQRRRNAEGTFRARWDKVLVVGWKLEAI